MKDLKFEDLPKASEEILLHLEQVLEELQKLKEQLRPQPKEELRTREETAKYLKIHISTLWHWSKKGILPSYGIGNRVYYKRSVLEKNLVKFRVQLLKTVGIYGSAT